MKNKFLTIFIILIFTFSCFRLALAEEFIFEVTDLEILENNTIFKGNNRGKVITDTEVELISNNFEYLKKINRLEANGDVWLTDIKSDVVINAEQIFYLKSKEIIYTIGKTFINVSNKYNIEGSDMTFLKREMILSSDKKTTINDNNSNIYRLDQFQYSVNKEILKGEKIDVIMGEKENKEDRHFYENGFFDLKNNEFLSSDVSILFHKKLFNDPDNDPRLKGVIGYGDTYNTYLDKGVFTTCKKTDKCPPWKMTAKNIRHDKVKKQIIYKNAWLELYDFPVVYFPKFFHPDPSVKRQTGLLRPEINDHNILGDSIYFPYFFAVSDDKDITVKPRLFNNNTFVLQNEYRQITKNSITIVDSSITTGHYSDPNNKNDVDTRSHFFVNSKINLTLENFITSDLEVNYEKASNDTYLNLFKFIRSPLLINKNLNNLQSAVTLNLSNYDYDLSSSIEMYETLKGNSSDRYQYVLPNYNFSKDFFYDNLDGGFNFSSSGYNTLYSTNVSETRIANDLGFLTFDNFFTNGIKTNFEFALKNVNSMGKNIDKYKNSPQSEIMSAYYYNVSLPLAKNSVTRRNTLVPKLSLRVSPHEMKNNSNSGRRIDADSAFSSNRISLGDSFEEGQSLTLGIDFFKEKVNVKNIVTKTRTGDDKVKKITEIEEYFDLKLAMALRLSEEENMPIHSTLNKKTSSIFGAIDFKPNKIISLSHNFSLTNDFRTFEYNNITAELEFDNFSTSFSFVENAGILGSGTSIENTTTYNFLENNYISFATRRDQERNLTEYYDLIYEYKNDCLIADIKYRKDYYNNADIKPVEELFFSLTIIPFYTYSPDKMILKKDRID